MKTIGILALQGGFEAHLKMLAAAGFTAREVRTPGDFQALHGLVLPGGESTTMLLLVERHGLLPALQAFVRSGKPVLCTCAGLILAARAVSQPAQPSFGFLDVAVARNAWGRQIDSFEAVSDDGALELVFIRAPRVTEVGPGVEVLATLRGEPVLVRQGNVTGATFHPELTQSTAVHARVFA